MGGARTSKNIREGEAKNVSYGKISSFQDYSRKMGQSVHFIKDLGSGHEREGAANLRSARVADTPATQQQMNKQLKLISDSYYCRPGKGAVSSNIWFYFP